MYVVHWYQENEIEIEIVHDTLRKVENQSPPRKLISTQAVVQPPGLEKESQTITPKTHVYAGRCSTSRTGKEKSNQSP